jgi:GH25 family lysozyme M1 (1,4-beta-N-acetylmuramidase)
MAWANGEDRSSFQAGGVSWSANHFGFTKATEGLGWTDPTFRTNWANLRAEGKVRGAYHFFHPGESAAGQAAFFVNYVKANGGWEPGDIAMADVEISVGADGAESIAPERARRMHTVLLQAHPRPPAAMAVGSGAAAPFASVSTSARAFMDAVGALLGPRCPVICYTYLSMAQTELPDCARYPLNVADYAPSAPANVSPWRSWTFWQNSDHGGQGGGDTDFFAGDEAALRAWVASYAPQDWTEALLADLPTLNPGAKDPVNGLNYVHRMQVLVAGIGRWNSLGSVTAITDTGSYTGSDVAAVKRVQAFFGLTPDGSVGPKTWGKLVGPG